MLKKILLTILISTFPLIAAAQLKVGIMNPERVMDALPETGQVQSDLEQFVQQKQEEFTAEYSVWIEAIGDFEERMEAGTLSEQERQREEQRLMEKEEDLGSLERRIQNQIQNRQNELLSPIMQRVENAMEEVARELDLEYVLNRQTSQGDLVVFYVSDRGIDITDRVIEKLTSN
jgi:outer membrane protein